MIRALEYGLNWLKYIYPGTSAADANSVKSPMDLKSLRRAVDSLYEKTYMSGRRKPWFYENGEIGVSDPPVESSCPQLPLTVAALKRALDRIEDKYPQYRPLKPVFVEEKNELVSIALGENGVVFRVNSDGSIVSSTFSEK